MAKENNEILDGLKLIGGIIGGLSAAWVSFFGMSDLLSMNWLDTEGRPGLTSTVNAFQEIGVEASEDPVNSAYLAVGISTFGTSLSSTMGSEPDVPNFIAIFFSKDAVPYSDVYKRASFIESHYNKTRSYKRSIVDSNSSECLAEAEKIFNNGIEFDDTLDLLEEIISKPYEA